MNILTFINENRMVLQEAIMLCGGNALYLDDEEIENWILNDEGLYNWARSEGVDI